MSIHFRRHPASVVFSGASLLLVGFGGWLEGWAPDAYYDVVQEDGPLEWATVWAFLLAAAVALSASVDRLDGVRFWRNLYLWGMALGCLLIALEEISWGQRLLAYRPPEPFLIRNYQQELNLHNLADSSLRKAALLALLLGFGVLLPIFGRVGPWARWLRGHGVPLPGLSLIPGYAAGAGLYLLYPWHNTGEWVECMAGFGFLAAAWDSRPRVRPSAMTATGVLLAAMAAGVLTPWLIPGATDAERLALAADETRALAEDFQVRRLRSRCGVHKRIYTFVEQYGARRMDRGSYVALPDPGGVHAERRAYFLDPWNQPYWIRDDCDALTQRRVTFVYSFGPDRRRNSRAAGIGGDDVGSYVRPPDTR